MPLLCTEIPTCRGLLVPIFQVSPGLLVLPHLLHEVTQKFQYNIPWELGCFLRLYTYTLSQPSLNHIWAVPYCLATVINTGLLEGISSCLSYTLSRDQQAPGTGVPNCSAFSDSPPFSPPRFFYLKVGGDPDRTSICPLAFTLPSPLLDLSWDWAYPLFPFCPYIILFLLLPFFPPFILLCGICPLLRQQQKKNRGKAARREMSLLKGENTLTKFSKTLYLPHIHL